jgi:hypothetical protein
MTFKSYNGYTPAERRVGGRAIAQALADGRMGFAPTCSVCDRTLMGPHDFHAERYDEPLSGYPICRRCHHAVHIRFTRPAYWRRFLAELPRESWVQKLTLDPASLWRPFHVTYPLGFPPREVEGDTAG